jgi:hypothetical protein
MGCIYNEKVERNMTPLLILLMVFGLSLLSVSYYVSEMGWEREVSTILDLFLTLVFLLAGYAVFLKGRETYRYSIIGDELIIHRLSGEKNDLVAKVKLQEIKKLQEKNGRANLGGLIRKNYCQNVVRKGCLCEYQAEGGSKSFYFSPSPSMLNKIRTGLQAS